ncbi:uncharacterized protein LOC124282404 [Haliotis rubra]|uniref:uncharacterized protein LOC124282404 n=1 Tax=Haliotis rubra TaxID=36100 RepID=UPI001EE5DE15|nr:uncharacterized protein LOC124282404 [Haliotis rubra]
MGFPTTVLLLLLPGAIHCLELKYLLTLPMSVEHEFEVKYSASKAVDAVLQKPGLNATLYPSKQGVFRIPGNESYLVGGKENKALILSLTTHDDVIIGSFEATVMCSAHWAEHYAYLALPFSALGTHYIISTYTPGEVGRAQMVIIASDDDTDVTIALQSSKPVTVLDNTYTKGQIIQLTLNQYQSLSFEASSDITGTVVRSSKAVAVFSGNFRNRFPFNAVFNNTRDPTFEQLPPVSLLGQVYVVPRIPSCVYQEAKFIAAFEGTVLRVSQTAASITLREADQTSLEVRQSLYLFASKPILVTTMCRWKTGLNPTSLTFIPPVERYKKVYPVPSPHTGDATFHLTIIACYSGKTGLTIDKNLLTGKKYLQWERVENFVVTTMAVPNGQHVVEADSPFALIGLVYEASVTSSTSQLCLGFDLEQTGDSFCSLSLTSPGKTTTAQSSSSHMPPTITSEQETSMPTYAVILVVVAAVAVVAVFILAAVIIIQRHRPPSSDSSNLTDSTYASVDAISRFDDLHNTVPTDSRMSSGSLSPSYIEIIHLPTGVETITIS